MTENFFEERKSIKQVEESKDFATKFASDGLIPVVTSLVGVAKGETADTPKSNASEPRTRPKAQPPGMAPLL